MALTKTTDHVTRALARLLEQNKASASHRGIVTAFVDQIQAIEEAFYAFLVLRKVNEATAAQLDAIGKLVGQAREGRTDADYRTWINAKILINRSSGEINTLVDVTKLLIPGCTATLVEHYPAGMIMRVTGVLLSTTFARQVATLLRSGKCGGVRLLLHYQVSTDAETFTLDTSPTGKGFGGAEPIDANTLAAWRLNEANAADAADDASTNNRDLAVSTAGGPTVGTGLFGACRQFRADGKAFIAPADVATRDAARDGAISFSCWVKPVTGQVAAGILCMINGADFSFDAPEAVLFEVLIDEQARLYWTQWQDTVGANVTDGTKIALTLDTWNHVLVTRTARNVSDQHEYKTYVNGVLRDTASTVPGLNDATITAVGTGASVHYVGLGCYRNNSGPTDAASVPSCDMDEARLSSTVRTLAEAQAGAQLTAGQLTGIC